MELDPGLIDDTLFLPQMMRMLDRVDAELIAAKGPARCYHGFMVGTITPMGLLDCSSAKCGVSWVQAVSAYPSSNFPAVDVESDARCQTPWAMELRLGVARCYPRPTDRNVFPDPQEMFNANRLYMSDFRALKRAALCGFVDPHDPKARNYRVKVGAWSPIEQQGGVSGGTLQVWIA